MASWMNSCTNDHVIGVMTSGIASPKLPAVHRYSPLRLSFHSSTCGGRPVIGRACTIANSPSRLVHSTSTGTPNSSWIRAPKPASSTACASSRTGRSRSSSGTARSSVPSAVRSVMTVLAPVVARTTTPRVTVTVSGVTCPPTTASPSPQEALITVSVRVPVTGSAVNRIPDASAGTSSWTTTASATSSWETPCSSR